MKSSLVIIVTIVSAMSWPQLRAQQLVTSVISAGATQGHSTRLQCSATLAQSIVFSAQCSEQSVQQGFWTVQSTSRPLSPTCVPLSLVDMTLDPHPVASHSLITLHLTSSTHARLELFNALGERVMIFLDQSLANTTQIDLNAVDLPSGIYMLYLTNDVGVSRTSIIIQH